MNKTLVIYHGGCYDGHTAAWVCWKQLKAQADHPAFFAAEYPPAGQPTVLPDVTGFDVLMVDFCVSREQLLEIKAKAKSFQVLDHHKTSQADCEGLDFCMFDMEQSGAGLAWRYFRGQAEAPWLVSYVEDRDLWRFALPDSKVINAYIAAHKLTTNFEEWSDLQNMGAKGALTGGRAVLKYLDNYIHVVGGQAIRQTFAGHDDIPVVNAPYMNTSELVGKLSEDAPFAVGWFQRGDGRYQFSLRSRGDFDVSEVAKRFGGGGHKNAAGFVVSERPT
jgi:oligoribonuclease NrnB/cAMP/cGMP phosphodiesterase (DHH superfamily)